MMFVLIVISGGVGCIVGINKFYKKVLGVIIIKYWYGRKVNDDFFQWFEMVFLGEVVGIVVIDVIIDDVGFEGQVVVVVEMSICLEC